MLGRVHCFTVFLHLGPPHLTYHHVRVFVFVVRDLHVSVFAHPCFSVVPAATYKARMKGAVSAQKAR